jgi:hypothetical protein
MSTIKGKKERRGGARQGTGPKPGSGEMKKISVSVCEHKWNNALSIWWRKRPKRPHSWLVDRLVAGYVETGGRILETEAV